MTGVHGLPLRETKHIGVVKDVNTTDAPEQDVQVHINPSQIKTLDDWHKATIVLKSFSDKQVLGDIAKGVLLHFKLNIHGIADKFLMVDFSQMDKELEAYFDSLQNLGISKAKLINTVIESKGGKAVRLAKDTSVKYADALEEFIAEASPEKVRDFLHEFPSYAEAFGIEMEGVGLGFVTALIGGIVGAGSIITGAIFGNKAAKQQKDFQNKQLDLMQQQLEIEEDAKNKGFVTNILWTQTVRQLPILLMLAFTGMMAIGLMKPSSPTPKGKG